MCEQEQSLASEKQELSSHIFILNTDCFDIIFEYLSLTDLHSFGLTCRTLNQIAGVYFRSNYKSSEKFSNHNGIYTAMYDNSERIQTSGFNRYITYISHYYEHHQPLHYIQKHSEEFECINHLYLVCLKINAEKVEYIRNILPKIETIQIRQCTLNGDFYEILLKYCTNLKRIYIQDDLGYIIDENESPWLTQYYPLLKHLQITPRYSFKINELSTFLQRNASLKSFTTSSRCLWENRHELMDLNLQLDKLEIQILDNYHRHIMNMQSMCCLLNEFHRRGFYKRLYLYVKRVDQKNSEHLASLNALEMLSIQQFTECYNLPSLINLTELKLNSGIKLKHSEIFAINLVNLERLTINNLSQSQVEIIPFIRHTVKLHRIRMNHHQGALNLWKLNNEREKLTNAKKIVIFVPNNIFLQTKWITTNGIINLSCIEMRRASQCSTDGDH